MAIPSAAVARSAFCRESIAQPKIRRDPGFTATLTTPSY